MYLPGRQRCKDKEMISHPLAVSPNNRVPGAQSGVLFGGQWSNDLSQHLPLPRCTSTGKWKTGNRARTWTHMGCRYWKTILTAALNIHPRNRNLTLMKLAKTWWESWLCLNIMTRKGLLSNLMQSRGKDETSSHGEYQERHTQKAGENCNLIFRTSCKKLFKDYNS